MDGGELPGFVGQEAALTPDAFAQDALASMEAREADWLPVASEDGQLLGVVDRQRLLASLILDVTSRLQTPDEKTDQ